MKLLPGNYLREDQYYSLASPCIQTTVFPVSCWKLTQFFIRIWTLLYARRCLVQL
ncbi:hypothetical protein YC2023_052674 [Brassica napus]|uniref:Uncharacterized protein n=1 Tax=Brassica oleracea TaxID=3712 RepID=A0A3P6BUX0_BRAOL|nr:unnamed protein product [Brassica oleracea]